MYLEKKFNENVFYYKDVFKDPKWIIDSLNYLDGNQDSHQAITSWYRWISSNNNDVSFGEKKDLFYLNKDFVSGEDGDLTRKVIKTMKDSVDKLCYQFFKDKEFVSQPNISPCLDMCRYEKGGKLGLHYDGQDGDKSLLYSIVMYFNDDYEGGEISFFIEGNKRSRPKADIEDKNIDFWVKPEPGSAMVFPSTYPYLHQSHPIKVGKKYMSTSFIFVDGYDPQNHDHVRKYRERL